VAAGAKWGRIGAGDVWAGFFGDTRGPRAARLNGEAARWGFAGLGHGPHARADDRAWPPGLKGGGVAPWAVGHAIALGSRQNLEKARKRAYREEEYFARPATRDPA
jgi:hypothetical protein